MLRISKLKNSIMIVGKKNITIREDIYIELVKLGGHGESMDDIIKKLLDFYERHRK
jgi:predicted CopG family antitoxin